MRPCSFKTEPCGKRLWAAPKGLRCHSLFVCAGTHTGKRKRKSKEGSDSKQLAPGSVIPPPPPTIAPPAPATPLQRTAFRRTKPTEEQRRSEKEAQEAAAAAAARAQTTWADGQSLRQVMEQGLGRRAQRQAPLMLVDGYNYLNKDPEVVALMAAGAIDRARQELHRRLLDFTADGKMEVVVVYDAMASGGSGTSTKQLSPMLQVAYAGSCEADTLLIAEAERLRSLFMRDPSAARRVLVVSDDRRIQEACGPTGWILGPGDGDGSSSAYDEVTAVACSYLIDALQRFERSPGSSSGSTKGRRAPSLQKDTAAWATAFLQKVQPAALPSSPRQPPLGYTTLHTRHPGSGAATHTGQIASTSLGAGTGHASNTRTDTSSHESACGATSDYASQHEVSDEELEEWLERELAPSSSSLDDLLGRDIGEAFGLDDIL